jgi:hypothetical protein
MSTLPETSLADRLALLKGPWKTEHLTSSQAQKEQYAAAGRKLWLKVLAEYHDKKVRILLKRRISDEPEDEGVDDALRRPRDEKR